MVTIWITFCTVFLFIAVTPREKPNRILSCLVIDCATLARCEWASCLTNQPRTEFKSDYWQHVMKSKLFGWILCTSLH
jgi:hypothetical protein